MTTQNQKSLPTGLAAAAIISSGIGTFVIGLLTTLSEASEGIGNALNWWNPAGPLSGKTGTGIIIWLISWAVMHNMWKEKDYDLGKAFTITLVLIGVGLLLTFPPFFEIFK